MAASGPRLNFGKMMDRQIRGGANRMQNFRTPSFRWRPNSFHKRAALRKTRRL